MRCKPHGRVSCSDPICRKARRWQAVHAPAKRPPQPAESSTEPPTPHEPPAATPVFVSPTQP